MDKKEAELRIEALLQEVCKVSNAYNPGGDYMGIVLDPSTGFVSFHNCYWGTDSHRPLDFVTEAGGDGR